MEQFPSSTQSSPDWPAVYGVHPHSTDSIYIYTQPRINTDDMVQWWHNCPYKGGIAVQFYVNKMTVLPLCGSRQMAWMLGSLRMSSCCNTSWKKESQNQSMFIMKYCDINVASIGSVQSQTVSTCHLCLMNITTTSWDQMHLLRFQLGEFNHISVYI